MIAPERAAFEAWITAPPRELSVERWPEDAKQWPGAYKNFVVYFAWEAWQARAAMSTCNNCGRLQGDADMMKSGTCWDCHVAKYGTPARGDV